MRFNKLSIFALAAMLLGSAQAAGPVISFQAPADNSYVATGGGPLWATVEDSDGVDGGSLTLTANLANQPFDFDGLSVTRAAAALADGYYFVSLTAADNLSNVASAAISFTVDSLTPTAQVYPANNSFTSITPTVWAQLSDVNLDPNSLTITVNGVDGHSFAAGSITSTGVPIYGLNSVTLTAVDLAGNTLVGNWVFTLSDDITPPVLGAGSPTGLTNSAQLAVTVSIVDAGVGVSSTGISVTVNTQPVPFVYDGSTLTLTAQLANGDQYVTVNATDNLGNAAAPYSFQFTLFAEHCSVASAPQSLTQTGATGTAGTGNGQFNGLWAVAFGPDGGFYTTEFNGNRVQRFAADGSYLGQWSGTAGPMGIAVDSAGSVYVADLTNSRISKFNADGTPNNAFSGGTTHHRGQGVATYDVSVAPNGDIYAAYTTFGTNGVRRMDSAGADLGTLGSSAADGRAVHVDEHGYVYVSSGDLIRKYSADLSVEILSFSTGGSAMFDIAVDGDGNVYATTFNGLRVFGPNGAPLANYSGGASVGRVYSWGTGSIGLGALENTGLAIFKNKLHRAFFSDVRFGTYGTLDCGVDSVLPHAAVPLPAGGATVVTTTALVRAFLYDSGGSGVDLASAEMRINGVKVAAGASHGHISYTATGLSDGEYIVSVDVRDQAGNSAPTLVWQFSVDLPKDSTPPTSSAPAPQGLTSTTRPRVSATLADNVGGSGINAGSIRMTLNGTQVAASLTNSTLVYAPISLPVGDYSVLVTFSDNAGNEAQPLAWSFSTQDQYCLTPVPVPVSQTSWVGSVNMYGIAVNEAGQVYVNQNGTMAYYDAAGNTLGSFTNGLCGPRGFSVASNGNIVWAAGSSGFLCFDAISFFGPTGGAIFTASGADDMPTDVAEDLDGNFWVTDTELERVYKFNSGLGTIASYSGFNNPNSVAVGPNNRIYVADTSNHRIRVLNAADGAVVQTIGSFGSGNGQFNNPQGVAVDPAGYIYVSDSSNNRIQVFNAAGVYQLTFGVGILNSPRDLAIKHGKIHVVDQNNNRVIVFSGASAPTGCVFDTTAPTVQPISPAPGSLTGSSNVAIRASLSDLLPGSGIATSTLKVRLNGLTVAAATDGYSLTYTAASLPSGLNTVTVDVSDLKGNAAQQLVWSFEAQAEYCSISYTPTVISSLGTFGSAGAGNGQFSGAIDTAFAPSGDIYVLDSTLNRIQRFNSAGAYQSQWGSFGTGVGQFAFAEGIGIDLAGNVYVADRDNSRISKFDSTGTPVNSFGGGTSNSFGTPGTGAGQFQTPRAVAVGPDGSIYVAQSTGTLHRIQRFASDGSYLNSLSNTVATGTTVAVDPSGRVYFDLGSNVRRFDSTLATLQQSFTTAGFTRLAFDVDGNIIAYQSPNARFYSPSGTLLATHNVGNGFDVTQQDGRLVRVGSSSAAGLFRLGVQVCGFDNMAPRAESPTPAGGSVTNTATPQLSVRLYDAHPSAGVNLGSITVTVDGLIVPHTATATAIIITPGALAAGLHTVTVDFEDNAGNEANQLVWSFTVGNLDTTPPGISAGSPTGLTGNASPLITAALFDADSGIDSATVVMSLNGNVVASITDGVTVSFTAAALADGVHTVNVDAKDNAGNTANQLSWSFTVAEDSEIPVINAASPVGVTSNADTIITASFVEAGSGIDTSTVVLTLNGVTQAASADAGSVTFTASALADGVYTVTVDARDLAGNIANQLVWQFTVVSDTLWPVASILSPTFVQPVTVAAGAHVDVSYYWSETQPQNAALSLFASGNVVLSSLNVDLQPYLGYGSQTATAQVHVPGGTLDGYYHLGMVVADASGNTTATVNINAVLVDGTAPTASLNLPTGTVIDAGGNTTITLQLDDATSGVDGGSVKLYLDGVLQTGATVQVNGLAASVSLTASNLSAGLHTVTVDYADVVGNAGATETWSFTMVRDNTAPVLGLVYPTTGTPIYVHASGTADVYWNYSELNPVQAIISLYSGSTLMGQSILSGGLSGTAGTESRITAVTLPITAPEGVYDLHIELTDIAGQSASLTATASVVVDNTAPQASAGLPAGGTVVITASPVIQASLSDLGGSGVDVGRVALRIDGAVVTPSSLTGALVSYNASALPDGLHTVSVELKDRSGNAAQTYVWSFSTDTQAPNVALTLPAAGAYVRGTPTVEALSSDAGAGVTRTAFYRGATLIDTAWFNGVGWADTAGNAFAGAATLWDTTLLADGAYVLSARSTDNIGNTGVSTGRSVTVDNTLPVVSINTVFSPTQYQAQTITGSLTEQNLAQLRVNGILATLNGTAPNYTYSAVLPLVPGANGVTVTATDLAGNSASQFSAITMDPTAAVHFISPTPGGNFRASTQIEVTAPSTANTLSLEVSDDGGSTWYSVGMPAVVSTVTTLNKNVVNGWRHTWDTIADGLADANGSYQLRAVAYDQYGVQLGSAVVANLSTDNTAPAISFVTLPAPVLVGPNLEVYQESVINQGTVTEAGPGQVRVLVEHYNSSNDHVSDSPAWLALLSDLRFSRDERLVDGLNRIVYTVVDGAGNSASAEATIHYVLPQNSGTICAGGGSLATPDGTAIQVPSGALLSCADLSITTVLRSLMASPADSYLKIVGEGRQIDPVSLVFQAQAVLTLPYTDADLDPDNNGIPDYSPASLRILFWDGSLWQNKGVDSIDTVTRRVTVRTNHLGLFALAADTAPTPTEPKVYLTRNPFRYGTDRPTAFVYEMPVPGRVTIKIYDKAGDLVRTLVEDLTQQQGRFTQVWDGLNNFDRFVGSGIYLFRFEAKLDNGQTKTVTKAIGVLK